MEQATTVPTRAQPNLPPHFAESCWEVDGVFPSRASLEDAIARLELAGFDRAELSLPHPVDELHRDTPDDGADAPELDEDSRQARTLETSIGASVSAVATIAAAAAAGAAAFPAVVAALAAGLGTGAVIETLHRRAGRAHNRRFDEAAAKGQLLLSVHLPDPARRGAAEMAMLAAGATRLASATRIVTEPDGERPDSDEQVEGAPVWVPGLRFAYRSMEWARQSMVR